MKSLPYHLKFLLADFERRKAKNRCFSLRAYARRLDLDPSALSRILNGKQVLSVQACETLVQKLPVTEDEKRLFLASVARECDRRVREKLGEALETASLYLEPAEMDPVTFAKVSDLCCLALLETPFLEGAVYDPEWLGRQVGLPADETRPRLDSLLEAGLLRERGGRLEKTFRHLTTADKARTTEALREQQRQIVRGADAALDSVPIDRRSMTGMVMAIDPERLPEAKRMIQQFMEELCDYLESGKRTRVYQLGVQLYPLVHDAAETLAADTPAPWNTKDENENSIPELEI